MKGFHYGIKNQSRVYHTFHDVYNSPYTSSACGEWVYQHGYPGWRFSKEVPQGSHCKRCEAYIRKHPERFGELALRGE